MTTSASGAGPAVTAKNYMPCAKVLPLHYSNIKSSRSGKSTRVAVCNFSLACKQRLLLLSCPFSQLLAECETRLAKNFLGRTCCQSQSAKACQKIIRCILITIQINEIIVIIPAAAGAGGSGSTFRVEMRRLHVENGKTPLERETFAKEPSPTRATWSQCCCCSSLTCHAAVGDNENVLKNGVLRAVDLPGLYRFCTRV